MSIKSIHQGRYGFYNKLKYIYLLMFYSFIFFCCSKEKSTPLFPEPTTVTDIDGNIYKTVIIGEQVWMAENLKVKHYNNGDSILYIQWDWDWVDYGTGAHCYYFNNPNHGTDYGYLYNWFAVSNNRKIAPVGWHIPSRVEWETLINYLGDYSIAGGKLKEPGTTHWKTPNLGASNTSHLTALPGGIRGESGRFKLMGEYGAWWTITENDEQSLSFGLSFNSPYIFPSYHPKQYGLSVRCVKD